MSSHPVEPKIRREKLAELETHLTFRISRLGKLLDIHSASLLKDSGLNLTAYRILLVLSVFRQTTAADLSRLMVLDRAQISRTVAELVASGHLGTRPDPGSKRRRLLSLTPKGRSAVDGVRGRFEDRQALLEARASARDLRGFSTALDQLSAYLADELDLPEATPTGLGTADQRKS